MTTSRTIRREEWWREYARWQLGKRDGPICVECASTATPEQGELRWLLHGSLCADCLAEVEGRDNG